MNSGYPKVMSARTYPPGTPWDRGTDLTRAIRIDLLADGTVHLDPDARRRGRYVDFVQLRCYFRRDPLALDPLPPEAYLQFANRVRAPLRQLQCRVRAAAKRAKKAP